MAEIPEAFKRHREGAHVSTAEVRGALDSGSFGVTFVDLVMPAQHLTDIYRRRVQHLEQKGTTHARQLAEDITGFCQAMEALDGGSDVAASAIVLEGGRVIIVWEAMPSRQLLGVFSVPDERMLAD